VESNLASTQSATRASRGWTAGGSHKWIWLSEKRILALSSRSRTSISANGGRRRVRSADHQGYGSRHRRVPRDPSPKLRQQLPLPSPVEQREEGSRKGLHDRRNVFAVCLAERSPVEDENHHDCHDGDSGGDHDVGEHQLPRLSRRLRESLQAGSMNKLPYLGVAGPWRTRGNRNGPRGLRRVWRTTRLIFDRTTWTVFNYSAYPSSRAVHRSVDSLCRHAGRVVRSLGIPLWKKMPPI
jgi:hypothetical protein